MGLLRSLQLKQGQHVAESLLAVNKILNTPPSKRDIAWRGKDGVRYMLAVLVDLYGDGTVEVTEWSHDKGTLWEVSVDYYGRYYRSEGSALWWCLSKALISIKAEAQPKWEQYKLLRSILTSTVGLHKDEPSVHADAADGGIAAFLGDSRWDI